MINQENQLIVKMTTKIVSVKVADIRPQYHDVYEWCQDPNNIYIGRGWIVFVERDGKKFRYPPPSPFRNPFKGSDAIDNYRVYLIQEIQSGNITIDQLRELKGKTLGCWCKTKKTPNQPCHGDVIVEIMNVLLDD